ncbi:MAG: hypothetical protein MJH10_11295 [Epibacterium sp.]|nr:hypothetical protein [Epibacterium sp.]NQX74132.1 hypothetical protein [Epibacterium sp.]
MHLTGRQQSRAHDLKEIGDDPKTNEIHNTHQAIQERQARYARQIEQQPGKGQPPRVLAGGRHDPHVWAVDFANPTRQRCLVCGIECDTAPGAETVVTCKPIKQKPTTLALWSYFRADGSLAPPIGDAAMADFQKSRDANADTSKSALVLITENPEQPETQPTKPRKGKRSK